MQAFFRKDWLRLYCLEIDNQIVAMDYCYRFKDRQAGPGPGVDVDASCQVQTLGDQALGLISVRPRAGGGCVTVKQGLLT